MNDPDGDGYYNATWDTTAVADGAYTVQVRANDTVNNVNRESVSVTVDNIPAPTGGVAPTPKVVKPGIVEITPDQAGDLVRQLGLGVKQFYVADPEIVATLATVGYFPATEETRDKINIKTWKPVKDLKGDVYELSANLVTDKYRVADKVVIARGDIPVDSMTIVAYAKVLNLPILLVEPAELPKVTEDALGKLGTKEVVIAGGPVAVSEDVKAQLPNVARIWGQNRYDTAVKVAEALMEETKVNTVVVTDGLKPDVMAVMIATYYKAPIVYTAGDEVASETKAFLEKEKGNFTRVVIVGVSESATAEIKSLMQ
jgi:hypothetical protein